MKWLYAVAHSALRSVLVPAVCLQLLLGSLPGVLCVQGDGDFAYELVCSRSAESASINIFDPSFGSETDGCDACVDIDPLPLQQVRDHDRGGILGFAQSAFAASFDPWRWSAVSASFQRWSSRVISDRFPVLTCIRRC